MDDHQLLEQFAPTTPEHLVELIAAVKRRGAHVRDCRNCEVAWLEAGATWVWLLSVMPPTDPRTRLVSELSMTIARTLCCPEGCSTDEYMESVGGLRCQHGYRLFWSGLEEKYAAEAEGKK